MIPKNQTGLQEFHDLLERKDYMYTLQPQLTSPFALFFSRVKRPSFLLALMESRAVYELGAYFLSYNFLKSAPKGDGHPVLIMPGLMTSDLSTVPLRNFLKELGYAPHGWMQGRNYGQDLHPAEGLRPDSPLFDHLDELTAEYGEPVTLIGWSLGGLLARELSRHRPDQIRQVITLGAPFNGKNPHATNVSQLFEWASGNKIEDFETHLIERASMPPPVPSTSIYSRTDGIAAWECCIEEEAETTENIGVFSSHFGLGHNPVVLWIIADRLAQQRAQWRPFDRSGLKALIYSHPEDPTWIW